MRQGGFSLVELLVAMLIFSIVSISFYATLFNATSSADLTRSITQASAEARRGFNRMIRDTREASALTSVDPPTDTAFSIEIDFDSDGTIEPVPSDASGNYERLKFIFNGAADGQGNITVTNGVSQEILVDHVDCLGKPDGTCYPVFSYFSNNLLYDTDGDGRASAAELDAAAGLGNGNGVLDDVELLYVDTVSMALVITVGDRSEVFYGSAQMRNQR